MWLWILCSGQGDLDNLATKYRRRCSLLYALLVHIHVLRRPPSSVANANVLRDRRHETSSATQLECFNSVFQDHSRVIEEDEAMKKLPSSSFQGELVMLHLCDPQTTTPLSQPPSSAFRLDQELEDPSVLCRASSEFCDKGKRTYTP